MAEGIGVDGLAWLKRVKQETGMYVATEVATAKHVYECLKAIFVLLPCHSEFCLFLFYNTKISEISDMAKS